MKKYKLFCLLLLFYASQIYSQDSLRIDKHIVTIAYFGDEITHPGFQIGYTYKALSSKNAQHSLLIGSYVGAYRFPFHSRGVFITPIIGYQLQRPKGFQYDFQVGIGYLHTFAEGQVLLYRDGAFSKVFDKGVSRSMLPYLSTGIGWHIKNIARSQVGLTPFMRLGMYGYYPVNTLWSYRLHCSVGVEITFRKK